MNKGNSMIDSHNLEEKSFQFQLLKGSCLPDVRYLYAGVSTAGLMKKTRKEDFKTTDEIHDLTFVNRRCAHKAILAVVLAACLYSYGNLGAEVGSWWTRTSRYLHGVVWCCGTFATF